jgi:hypothetical protein
MKKITWLIFLAALHFNVNLAIAQTGGARGAEWVKTVEAAKKEGKVVASIPPTRSLEKG